MIKFLDRFLNRITMYRLVLYCLEALLGLAFIFSWFKVLPFGPSGLVYSFCILFAACWLTNKLFAYFFEIPANVESNYITAMILSLIISAPAAGHFISILPFLIWAGVISMASKYVLAIKGKHVFNPAGISLVILFYTLHQYASWWVGSIWMLPAVLIIGILVVRKTQRLDMVLTFYVTAFGATLLASIGKGNLFDILWRAITDTPIMFFSFIMLTEPLTTPPTDLWQMVYGGIVGLLFAPFVHLGPFYSTPEQALAVGNIFSYFVSPKNKYILTLVEKSAIAQGVYEFAFQSNYKLNFKPGQYLEWTIDSKGADLRGNRRYFTVASSPTEQQVRLGVRFYEKPSTFKQNLLALPVGDKILASHLAGDFVLPHNPNEKLVFIAGGIGITPFRSMIKYLLDNKENRDIVLFYSNKNREEGAYHDLIEQAEQQMKLKVVQNFSDTDGYMTRELFRQNLTDIKHRKYYISGPDVFVRSMRHELHAIGVSQTHIRTDFFPGLV